MRRPLCATQRPVVRLRVRMFEATGFRGYRLAGGLAARVHVESIRARESELGTRWQKTPKIDFR